MRVNEQNVFGLEIAVNYTRIHLPQDNEGFENLAANPSRRRKRHACRARKKTSNKRAFKHTEEATNL